MSQAEITGLLAIVLGYAQQWLRAYRWYSDGLTLFVSIVLGMLGAFWIGGPALADWRTFVGAGVQIGLQILGGTAIGHMAAQVNTPVMLAPKFNSFSGGTK